MKADSRTLLLAVLALLAAAPVQSQDDPASACREAAKLFEEDDIQGALEEARWCVEALEQLKQNNTAQLFPDEVAGYVGGETNSQSTMGINLTERTYSKGSRQIDVNYTAGGAGGGLAAIAKMGMAMGAPGQKLRIQRYVVMDTSEGQNADFMVSMKSGGMLSVSSNNAGRDEVIKFLESFPIKELDQAGN